ncbi:MAG: serine hydrolase domain-containing protein [Mycobacterium sp.]
MSVARRVFAVTLVAAVLAGCSSGSGAGSEPEAAAEHGRAEAVLRIVRDTMDQSHLKAVIVRVTVDGEEVLTEAVGESMTSVPATPDMHFRNGAVAISYVSTLLLTLVDEHKIRLDDKLSTWLPEIPHADRVTLGQLAQMTSGYVDYVIGNTAMNDALYADPFRRWTTHELLSFAVNQPLLYEPGTNWSYAHTNYVLLGLALEKATGKGMAALLSEKVLRPLGLTSTASWDTAQIPAPVLHAFTSERRAALKIPADIPFYEESTYWDPSWTITHGAIQTTNIYDMEAGAAGIGSGKLLSAESHRRMVSTDLRGRTHTQPGCTTCAPMTQGYTYGLGIVISGNWLLQNPMFGGYAAIAGYLPSEKISIAVAVTFAPEAFDAQGDYSNTADTLFRRIGAELAPEDAPPVPSKR